MARTWKVTVKAKNSPRLLEAIQEMVEDGINHRGVKWSDEQHRETFVTVLEDVMEEYIAEDLITQYDVKCDNRNNNNRDMAKGEYHVEVTFRQKNCLNTTELHYVINDK